VTTTAAGTGAWSFTGLGPEVIGHKVLEVQQNGYVQTVGTAGYSVTADASNLNFANFLKDPKIDIEKYVSTNVVPAFADADNPDGSAASTSTTVQFKVVVTNNGNETLSDITLTDSVIHTVNGVPTSQTIVYTPDGNPSTLDAFDVFVDLNHNGTQEAGEAWINFDIDGDGVIDSGAIAELSPNESFELYYSLTSPLLGQHENTAHVDAVSAISNTTVSDNDDANYYVLEEDCVGVRTPGFWANTKWAQFWNFDPSKASTLTDQNSLQQFGQPNFPGGELLYKIDTNKDGVVDNASGLLIGDYNKNGITDAGEDTIYISLSDAKLLIDASNKNLDGKAADGIWMLGRDVVAAWLNYLANNPDNDTGNCVGPVDSGDGTNSPREFIDAAVDWLQQFASDANSNAANNLINSYHDGNHQATFQFDTKIAPSSGAWQNAFTPGEDIPVSAAAMHSAIDLYNNTGTINGIEYCCDADSPLVLNVLSQII